MDSLGDRVPGDCSSQGFENLKEKEAMGSRNSSVAAALSCYVFKEFLLLS